MMFPIHFCFDQGVSNLSCSYIEHGLYSFVKSLPYCHHFSKRRIEEIYLLLNRGQVFILIDQFLVRKLCPNCGFFIHPFFIKLFDLMKPHPGRVCLLLQSISFIPNSLLLAQLLCILDSVFVFVRLFVLFHRFTICIRF